MSYLGKRIRNNYPLWSKIRGDESSFGGMLLDAVGNSIEEVLIDSRRINDSLNALRELRINMIPSLFIVNLNNISSYNNFRLENNIERSILENLQSEIQTTDDFSQFVVELPETISINAIEDGNPLILLTLTLENDYVDGPVIIEEQFGDKVYIELQENVLFKEPQETEEIIDPKIILRGIDENNDEVEEIIYIDHKKIYESKFKYKKLIDLVRDEGEGISGGKAIEFVFFEKNTSNETWVMLNRRPILVKEKQHEFHTLTKIVDDVAFSLEYDEENTDSLLSNNACIKLSYNRDQNDTIISNSFEYIMYAYKNAYSYQRKETIQYKERFTNTITKKLILKSDETPSNFIVWDFDFDYKRNLIATISDDFRLRYYRFEKTPFVKKIFDRTRFVDFEFEGEQYVSYGEASDIFVNLSREKHLVKSYFIARHSPSNRLSINRNEEFNFEYLQNDGTWDEDFNFFYRETGTKFLEDFLPKRISSGDYLEVGQWDYYVFSVTDKINDRNIFEEFNNSDIDEKVFKNELLAAAKKPNQTKVNINHYSVMVDNCSPVAEYNLTNEFTQASASSNWGNLSDIERVGVNLVGNEEELEFIVNKRWIVKLLTTYRTAFLNLDQGILAVRGLFTGEATVRFIGENNELILSTES